MHSSSNKIALITYTLNCGGVSVCIFNLAEYLTDKGYQVDIITTIEKGIWFDYLKKPNISFINIPNTYKKYIPLGGLLQTFFIARHIKKANYNSIFLNFAEYGHLALPFIGKQPKVFSIIHSSSKGVIKTGLINHRFINSIICVSPKVKDLVSDFLNSNKIKIILNGIKMPNSKLTSINLRNGGQLRIIYVGSLHEQKGILLIPDILMRLKEMSIDFALTIIGDGPHRNKLIEILNNRQLFEHVTLIKIVPNSEINNWYTNHHVFLLPSYFEGLPLTLIEAMAAGCIPVVSKLDKITDICIDDKVNGFLQNVADCEGFANTICSLANDSNRRKQISECASKKAKTELSVEKMGNSYLKLIEAETEIQNKNIVFGDFLKFFSITNIIPLFLVHFYNEKKASFKRK